MAMEKPDWKMAMEKSDAAIEVKSKATRTSGHDKQLLTTRRHIKLRSVNDTAEFDSAVSMIPQSQHDF